MVSSYGLPSCSCHLSPPLCSFSHLLSLFFPPWVTKLHLPTNWRPYIRDTLLLTSKTKLEFWMKSRFLIPPGEIVPTSCSLVRCLHQIGGIEAPVETSDAYASWKKIAAIVLQWIYRILYDELLVRVLEFKSTALESWTRIKNLFHNNMGAL